MFIRIFIWDFTWSAIQILRISYLIKIFIKPTCHSNIPYLVCFIIMLIFTYWKERAMSLFLSLYLLITFSHFTHTPIPNIWQSLISSLYLSIWLWGLFFFFFPRFHIKVRPHDICFSPRGSSQPMDQTQVSCIAGRFFTSWATREALISFT